MDHQAEEQNAADSADRDASESSVTRMTMVGLENGMNQHSREQQQQQQRPVLLSASSGSSQHHHHNSSLRMEDVGLLMREQDAYLLESIHINGPNQTGMTPLLRSTSPAALSSDVGMPPPLSLLQENGFEPLLEENGCCEEHHSHATAVLQLVQVPSPKGKNKNQLLPFLPSGSLSRQHSNEITSTATSGTPSSSSTISPKREPQERQLSFRQTNHLQLEEETATISPLPQPTALLERCINRRVLSGQIFEEVAAVAVASTGGRGTPDLAATLSAATAAADHAAVFQIGTVAATTTTTEAGECSLSQQQPSSSGTAQEIEDGDYSNDNNSTALLFKRTESNERRLNEAAQFAEAVGDLALTEQKDLRIIEDDCDDDDAVIDDDDDDATEIHIPKRGTSSGGGVQVKRVSPNEAAASAAVASSLLPTATEAFAPPLLPDATSLQLQQQVAAPETPVKTRPQWPAEQFHHRFAARSGRDLTATTTMTPRSRAGGFLAQLPSSLPSASSSHGFVYKGIRANPPEVVERGTTRGNYAQLHRKAWLEVSDKYHRYGKHLRLYYRYWERLGCPTNMFFDWLDSKGEAAGQPLPELSDCPRSQLDSDTVLYISNPDVTQGYAVQFCADEEPKKAADNEEEQLQPSRVVDVDGDPVCTGSDGWIFVLRDNVMYGAQKITSVSGQSKQRFHHSSFFGGKAVAAAGIFITDDEGYLTRLYPHSGHYRPGEAHMQRVLFYLYHEGVDLRTFNIDTQQIVHVARDGGEVATTEKSKEKTVTEGKKKKTESLHLMPAVLVACFLAHKARFIGEGIFAQIHQIRKTDVASVTEALAVIDNGGFWRRRTSGNSSEGQ